MLLISIKNDILLFILLKKKANRKEGKHMNKDDIRVIKTAKSIHQAFFSLLEEKNYQEITIQDILDGAQINRTTFYKHYANKDALAKQLVEEFKHTIFFPILERRFNESSLEFIQKEAPLMLRNKEIIRLLWKIETSKIHLKQDMYQLIKRQYIEALSKETIDNELIDLEFQGHIYASLALASISFSFDLEQEVNPLHLLENLKMLFQRAIL